MPNGSWNFTHADGGDGSLAWLNTTDSRPLRWAGEQNPWLHGYPMWDWADEYEHVIGVSKPTSGGPGARLSIDPKT